MKRKLSTSRLDPVREVKKKNHVETLDSPEEIGILHDVEHESSLLDVSEKSRVDVEEESEDEKKMVKPTHWDKKKVPSDINKAFKSNPDLLPQNFDHYNFFMDDKDELDVERPEGSQSPLLQLHDYDDDICGFNLTSLHSWGEDEDKKKKRLNDFSITQTRPKDATFDGDEREYPMEEYDSPYQRSHGIDHADGNKKSTTSVNNFTPHTKNYNEGIRNHTVRGMRNKGGGFYSEQNHYGDSTLTSNDGKLVPKETTFTVAPRVSTDKKKKSSKHDKLRQWKIPQQGKKTLVGQTIEDANPFLVKEGDSKVPEGTHKYQTKEEKEEWKPDDDSGDEYGY